MTRNPPRPTVAAPATPAAGLPDPGLAAQAIVELLRPLARMMIGHGLQFPSAAELLKQALVDEAAQAYGLADKGSSDSRIALLTGVHRKDVKRLRGVKPQAVPAAPMLSIAAAVVARWISDPLYLDADQTARPLARTPKHSQLGVPDFTALVATISRDVGARAVLDELLRLGVVGLQDDGQVALTSSAFVPKEGLQESFHFLAANVSDHLATAVHNLAPDRSTPPMLEQSVFSTELSAAQAETLQLRARQLWAATAQQFLQTTTVAEQRSEADAGPRHRVRFGVYFHDAVTGTPALTVPRAKAKSLKIKKTAP